MASISGGASPGQAASLGESEVAEDGLMGWFDGLVDGRSQQVTKGLRALYCRWRGPADRRPVDKFPAARQAMQVPVAGSQQAKQRAAAR